MRAAQQFHKCVPVLPRMVPRRHRAPLPSRKRTKVKERKAKAEAQAASHAESERPWWMIVAGWAEGRACHPVSRFMDEIMSKSSKFYAIEQGAPTSSRCMGRRFAS